MEEQMKLFKQRIEVHNLQLQEQNKRTDDQFNQIIKLLQDIGNNGEMQNPTTGEPVQENQNHGYINFGYIPKIEFPSFDGNHCRTWIQKCDKYFHLCKIPDERKVDIAAIHMVGKAESWVKAYITARRNVTWTDFILDVCSRFKDSKANMVEEFNKLNQTSDLEKLEPRLQEQNKKIDDKFAQVLKLLQDSRYSMGCDITEKPPDPNSFQSCDDLTSSIRQSGVLDYNSVIQEGFSARANNIQENICTSSDRERAASPTTIVKNSNPENPIKSCKGSNIEDRSHHRFSGKEVSSRLEEVVLPQSNNIHIKQMRRNFPSAIHGVLAGISNHLPKSLGVQLNDGAIYQATREGVLPGIQQIRRGNSYQSQNQKKYNQTLPLSFSFSSSSSILKPHLRLLLYHRPLQISSPEKIVFRILRDSINLPAMTMWLEIQHMCGSLFNGLVIRKVKLLGSLAKNSDGSSLILLRKLEGKIIKREGLSIRDVKLEVLVEETASVRTFILNRPKQLNALSSQMMSQLLELFNATEGDSNIKMIILKGNGRAFCAGGDVIAVVHNVRQGNWKLGADYFREEFTLNYVMATCSKPQVSILNGIVMGGGLGASVHGRFRVSTEKSVCAMPETSLGLFPDVGASYFYSRLPGFFGEYAGLTGARLDGAEMLACGLATHFVPSERLKYLEQALAKVNTSDSDVISAIISRFSHIPKLKEESPYHKMKIIDRCFSRNTIEEIISSLENEALDKNDDWISSTIQSLKKASPTSLKISLRSIREGRLQGVGSCLIREYRMVCHVLRGEFSKDFFEGCRAILIDKDRNPKWEPSRLELIRDDDVDRYFSKIDDEDWEDLKLPPRSNLPPYAIAKL